MPNIEQTASRIADWERVYLNDSETSCKNLSQAFWNDVLVNAESVIHKIGKDGNVSKEELARSIECGSVSGHNSPVAAAIYNRFDRIDKNNHDRNFFGFDIPALSLEELKSFASKSQRVEENFGKVHSLKEWAAEDNLRRFSFLSNGELSYTDLILSEARTDLSCTDREQLSELKANFNSIAKHGYLGTAQINSYYSNFLKSNEKELKECTFFKRDMQWVDNNQKETTRLFANSDNLMTCITPNAVLQAYASDCAFKATLAGLADARPQEIPCLIKESAGGYSVQLKLGRQQSVQIGKPTDMELGLFSHDHNPGGFWPAVLAKAYGKMIYDQNWQNMVLGTKETIDEWAGHDGNQLHAIEALTGHKSAIYTLDQISEAELGQRLFQGQQDKRVMVLNTAQGHANSPDGFMQSHAFTVLNVARKNGAVSVTVRDPRYSGENRPDGTITIPLSALMKNFHYLFVEYAN